MSRMQVIAVTMMVVLNALDGFDVLSISFASPGIAREWGIDRAALGVVLAMELIGMAIGSVLLGRLSDRIGRRQTMLICLVIMTVGMFMVTTVSTITELSVWRVITGLGIGGMLASINAVAAEFSSSRRKHLSVSLTTIGYPIGAVIGGTIAAQLLKTYDWRSVFYLGTAMTVVCVPLVYLFVPESVYWLAHKRPAGALEKINSTLKRMGHRAIEALPDFEEGHHKRSLAGIFSPALIATTIMVTLAYFFHITTFYFVIKWVPKIVVDMGYEASSAVGVLVWANVGGALGGALLGFLTLRYTVKSLTIAVLLMSMVMVTIFGRSPDNLAMLSLASGAAGFFTNAGVVGLYALFVHSYPTHVRASGTGFSIGIGRGGAMLSPIIAGVLFESGVGIPGVALIMAFGSLLAILALLFLKMAPEEHEMPLPAASQGTTPQDR
ncbi:MFS transporter [Gammaproteobacteria bacterium]|jgi:benzoate transport|nr:MFS transporter [Gammaproteobacteria bacterium]